MTLPRLTDIEQRAQKATEGPWEQDPFTNALVTIGGDLAVAEDVYTQEDREFISASRQDVPALTAAIRAVLELHKPSNSSTYCPEDADPHPCPTVEAIREHLDVNP